jgi:dTDP-4-dehydrorhamnose 3,5-epimerase
MIEGVKIISKKKILDERGAIFHMLRCDDPEFEKFGEIYFSQIYPTIVKGWHKHREMTLNYLLVTGKVRLVLYDDRQNSSTQGLYQTFILSEDYNENKLIRIPPMVWNAFQCISSEKSVIANCSTLPHDPEEIIRKDIDDRYFNFDWPATVDDF